MQPTHSPPLLSRFGSRPYQHVAIVVNVAQLYVGACHLLLEPPWTQIEVRGG